MMTNHKSRNYQENILYPNLIIYVIRKYLIIDPVPVSIHYEDVQYGSTTISTHRVCLIDHLNFNKTHMIPGRQLRLF